MFTVAVLIVIAALSIGMKAKSPLESAGQLVLVLADSQETSKARLYLFDREGDTWSELMSCPAVIGANGMAWGLGLHDNGDAAPGDPVKREGDGKSPEGAFAVLDLFGYLTVDEVETGLQYTQVHRRWICCDESGSRHYNRVFNYGEKGLDGDNLPSHEDMRRSDDLYKYTILVGHNYWHPEPGGGSCIFIHLWEGPGSVTSGCTTISEENMLGLIKGLDQAENPVMVMLSRDNFSRLREKWSLPDVGK